MYITTEYEGNTESIEPTEIDDSNDDDDELNVSPVLGIFDEYMYILIAGGGVLICCCAIGLLYCFWKRRKLKSKLEIMEAKEGGKTTQMAKLDQIKVAMQSDNNDSADDTQSPRTDDDGMAITHADTATVTTTGGMGMDIMRVNSSSMNSDMNGVTTNPSSVQDDMNTLQSSVITPMVPITDDMLTPQNPPEQQQQPPSILPSLPMMPPPPPPETQLMNISTHDDEKDGESEDDDDDEEDSLWDMNDNNNNDDEPDLINSGYVTTQGGGDEAINRY